MTGQRSPRTASRGRRRAPAVVLGMAALGVLAACGGDTGSPGPAPTVAAPSTEGSAAVPQPDPPVGPQDAVRTVVLRDDDGAWPDLLTAALGEAGVPVSLTDVPVPASGFAAGPSFAEQVAGRVAAETQPVVLVDSRLDDPDDAALGAAVGETLSAVEEAAPDARVVVVGPLWPATATATLRTATEEGSGRYVDSAAEGWPESPSPQEFADLLQPHVELLADQLAASGANR